MFEKVLIPTDFSEYAQITLECIGDIPGVKEVVLLHVVDTVHLSKKGLAQDLYTRDAAIRLDKQKKQLENLGLDVKVKIEVITGGDVSRAILDALNKEKIALVIMGAHGKSLIEGILLGSVATDVLRYGNTHVLIMRNKFTQRHGAKKDDRSFPNVFSKVLLPVDFSEPAMETLSLVKDMNGIKEAVLVHVVDKGETQVEIDTCIKEAKKRLEDIAKDFRSEGIKVKIHVLTGSPSESIISMAEEENVSLIILSTLGKGMFRELLLGGTARDVARRTNRSVLAVRAGKLK
ncbi:MAG: universal stress protein [Euryarchaeota archaeon]|nr:universal stress protein [Euryarchaeota archaeon]